jgi:probable rRNA maturation factor
MNVLVLDEQDDPLPSLPTAALARIVLDGEGLPAGTEVAITFVTADRIAALNEDHLGKAGATDVLSFPLEDLAPDQQLPDPGPDGPPMAIGDVLICPGVVRARARETGVALEDEMALMVVHGLLHLLGYDHVADDDAELMESRERHYLALTGRSRP